MILDFKWIYSFAANEYFYQCTTEAEYVAASMVTKEIVWVKRLLDEIGHKIEKPINLYVDNLSAIQLANHPTLSRSTKHIEVKFDFIRDKVDSKEIIISYVHSDEQLADLLAKVLPKDRYNKLKNSIGMSLN